jgi:5-methylcytosine-specific restriction protein A
MEIKHGQLEIKIRYEVNCMPLKSKKPCAFPGCPQITGDYYCGAHKKSEGKQYNKYTRGNDSNKRYGNTWKKIRGAFLANHPLCEMCMAGDFLTPATLVHHKKPLADGGTHAAENLMSTCASCHESIHRQQGDRT